jgi:hypothetical protein
MLQKKSTKVDPHYLYIWHPTHEGDAAVTDKLVSNNSLVLHIICYICIYSIFCRNDIPLS